MSAALDHVGELEGRQKLVFRSVLALMGNNQVGLLSRCKGSAICRNYKNREVTITKSGVHQFHSTRSLKSGCDPESGRVSNEFGREVGSGKGQRFCLKDRPFRLRIEAGIVVAHPPKLLAGKPT